MIIIARRNWGVRDFAKSLEDKGRKQGKPKGSYVVDLADLKKAIVLCRLCRKGFNPKKHHYQVHRKMPFVQGRCDVCKEPTVATLFIHESMSY